MQSKQEVKLLGYIFGISLVLLSTGCVTGAFSNRLSYDQKPITIQTLSLFNQRAPSRFSKNTWRGDWILRRNRLELIDAQFQRTKPDILIVQESMSKKENTSESDRNILLAGALKDYDWYLRVTREYEDTQEVESMATAVGLPLKINRAKILSGRELWDIGHEGYLVASVVDDGDAVYPIFNVQMPEKLDNRELWYSFITDKIKEKLLEFDACATRLIVAGYITGNSNSTQYQKFLRNLGLKDTSAGYCEQESICATATPENELFLATNGDLRPERVDRVLVHETAQVISGRVSFERPGKFRFASTYGMSNLWPTQRFGWITNVRFLGCN